MDTEILVSLIALIIALTSTVINYLMLKGQTEPEVIVYSIPDPNRVPLINIVIENKGNASAKNITFKSNIDIPHRAFGLESSPMPEVMKSGPFISGIECMVAKEKRTITWGRYEGLKKGLEDKVLEISIEYTSSPPLSLRERTHKTTSTIDILSYEGTDASDSNWAKKTAQNLERIAKALEKSSG